MKDTWPTCRSDLQVHFNSCVKSFVLHRHAADSCPPCDWCTWWVVVSLDQSSSLRSPLCFVQPYKMSLCAILTHFMWTCKASISSTISAKYPFSSPRIISDWAISLYWSLRDSRELSREPSERYCSEHMGAIANKARRAWKKKDTNTQGHWFGQTSGLILLTWS